MPEKKAENSIVISMQIMYFANGISKIDFIYVVCYL